MIASLKPYPSYKDSGAPWLGKVPEYWDILPAFAVYKEKYDSNKGLRETTVLSLSYGKIKAKPKSKQHGLVPESFETYQIVYPNDIVIRTTDLQNDRRSVRVARSEDRGIITSAYLVLSTRQFVHPGYGYLLLRLWDISKAIYGYGSGMRQSLSFSDFKRMPTILPPVIEQHAIVKFLDWAERRIRFIIAARRRRIQLLGEYRQALINDAVTGKFDVRTGKPYPIYKDSGVPWLGKVPKHWKARKLRQVLNRIDIRDRPDMPLLSVTREKGVILRDITNKDENHNFIPDDLSNYKVVHRGQLVINKMKAWQGSYGVSHYDGIVSPAYFVFDIQGVEARFLHAALRSKGYIPFFMQASGGVRVGQWDLSMGQMKEIPFYLPPLPEQRAIAEYLDRETEKIDAAIEKTKESIALWEELRETLISDVVTGKLDVRKAAERLPEEESELEEKVKALEASLLGGESEESGADSGRELEQAEETI